MRPLASAATPACPQARPGRARLAGAKIIITQRTWHECLRHFVSANVPFPDGAVLDLCRCTGHGSSRLGAAARGRRVCSPPQLSAAALIMRTSAQQRETGTVPAVYAASGGTEEGASAICRPCDVSRWLSSRWLSVQSAYGEDPTRQVIVGDEAKGVRCVAVDLRFTVPLFMIDEAARHLGLPRSTMSDWTRRQAGPASLVHRVEPESPRSASLPFVGLVEAHVLRGFRELGLSAQGLRESVRRLRERTHDEYALATRNVATDGVDLLVNMAESCDESQWVRAVDGQAAISGVIERYLTFVHWPRGQRYPTRLRLKTYPGGRCHHRSAVCVRSACPGAFESPRPGHPGCVLGWRESQQGRC